MSLAETINDTLVEHLAPARLDIVNESHKHNVPDGSESHFKVTVVSQNFEGIGLVPRHRMVNKLLADLLAGPVHALSLHTYTLKEWQDRGEQVPASPPCRGGSKHAG